MKLQRLTSSRIRMHCDWRNVASRSAVPCSPSRVPPRPGFYLSWALCTSSTRIGRRPSMMYGGLSIAYGEIGQLNQSAYYAHRALSIHEMLNDRLSLARSENNLG